VRHVQHTTTETTVSSTSTSTSYSSSSYSSSSYSSSSYSSSSIENSSNLVALLTKEEAPSFNRPLPPTEQLMAGQTFAVRGAFSGLPSPNVQWFKNGEEVKNNSRTIIRITDYDSSLNVSDIDQDDAGKYSLKITNSLGSQISECQLELEKQKKSDKPKPERKVRRTQESEVRETPRSAPAPTPAVVEESAPEPPPVKGKKHSKKLYFLQNFKPFF
jgi:hypothetical protein